MKSAMSKGVWVAALAALLVLAPRYGVAQQPGPKGASAQKKAEGGPTEGIKVHGHWTIVIKNADGSIASRHEFDNALYRDGQALLAALLSRSASVGPWYVLLDSTGGVARPCIAGGVPNPCAIAEPGAVLFPNLQNFPNLVMQATGTPATTIVLSGSAKSPNGGQIEVVSTDLGSCSPTVLPSVCATSPSATFGFAFTQHFLASPIPVQAGQTIDVTVTISFS